MAAFCHHHRPEQVCFISERKPINLPLRHYEGHRPHLSGNAEEVHQGRLPQSRREVDRQVRLFQVICLIPTIFCIIFLILVQKIRF